MLASSSKRESPPTTCGVPSPQIPTGEQYPSPTITPTVTSGTHVPVSESFTSETTFWSPPDYTNRSTLALQVKAGPLSPQLPNPTNYATSYPHNPYYPGVGVDLAYFGNHSSQAPSAHQYSSYIPTGNPTTHMLRTTSEYTDHFNVSQSRYQPL